MTDPDRNRCVFCRRELLIGGGAALTAGLAGCLGGEEEPAGGEDGEDPGDGDDGDDGEPADGEDGEDPGDGDDFPEFDPDDPQFPQRMSTLIEHEFQTGRIEDLEAYEERDEVAYGDPPQEVEDDDERIDPDPLVFALVPTEDPAIYEDMVQPILDNIEEETGREVENFAVDSYAAQIEAMRAERLHIAGFSTGSVPFAVNLAGAVPFAIQVGEENFGYRLWAVTHMDNEDINSVEDFEGRQGAHGDPSSNSGNLMPRALFDDRFGVEPGEDYEVEHIGSHENVILSIYHKDHEVAPVCSTCVARVAERGDIDPEDIKVVWSSDPIVTTGFSYRYNLPEDVIEGIQRAFLDYDYFDTEFAEEFEGRGQFVEIDYATHWHDILVTHRENDIDYDIEEA